MHFLLKDLSGVKVLLYHHVFPGKPDDMTVSPDLLEIHLRYLKQNGYKTIPVSELVKDINNKEALPEKTVVITFDDGYKNQIEFVEPLLKKYGFCACIFLIAKKIIEQGNIESKEKYSYLYPEAVLNADPACFEFGLHGYDHQSYEDLTIEGIRNDILSRQEVFASKNINVLPVVAYPFGKKPKSKRELENMKNVFKEMGICAAFRIGNRAIQIPVFDQYELTRININGWDTLENFKIKLRKGKLKPF